MAMGKPKMQHLARTGPGQASLGGSLTCIFLLLGVFDVGRELGEDVNACGVGLPVSRSQFGVPGREGTVLYETVRKGLFRDKLVCIAGGSILFLG